MVLLLLLLLVFLVVYDRKRFYVYLLAMLFVVSKSYLSVGYMVFKTTPPELMRFVPLVLGVAVLFLVMLKRRDKNV